MKEETKTVTTRVDPLTSDKIEQLLIRQNEHLSTIKGIMQFYLAVMIIGALNLLLMSLLS